MHHNPTTLLFFFFNDTATTEIYTLSLHDALPISHASAIVRRDTAPGKRRVKLSMMRRVHSNRSEEHTSELQSPCNLVCRLLLEKKKNVLVITHEPLLADADKQLYLLEDALIAKSD